MVPVERREVSLNLGICSFSSSGECNVSFHPLPSTFTAHLPPYMNRSRRPLFLSLHFKHALKPPPPQAPR